MGIQKVLMVEYNKLIYISLIRWDKTLQKKRFYQQRL